MALYGLKQAPRAWYECFKDFLIRKDFEICKANPTLFTHKVKHDIFVCQIYVDDIIFGSTNQESYEDFSRIMTKRFDMSMMGEFVRPGYMGLTFPRIRVGTWPTPYICCNYS
jgi:hypothetical protein